MTTITQDPATLRLAAGRALAVDKQPYLATALHAIRPVKTMSLPTLGVDKHWRMYWNPEFILTLSVPEVAGAWLHEVGHLLREHGSRFERLLEPQNRHPLWNRAGDAAINADLRTAGIILPQIKAVYPEHIPGAEEGMTTEEMYRLVLNTPEADKVETQKEQLRITPNGIIEGKVQGQRIIGITRSGFLDRNDYLITVTAADGSEIAITEDRIHDKRTLDFTMDQEAPKGDYLVSVTSGDKTVTADLSVVTPSISFRPDHIESGWNAPYKVTVVGTYTEFNTNTVVTMKSAEGIEVQVTDIAYVSRRYLTFNIGEPVTDGIYTITVTNGTNPITGQIPIGLPFMDIVPESLPVGHGTPYPFAAVVSDFTFDATTDIVLHAMTPLGPLPLDTALSPLTIKSPTTADFNVVEPLDEGQYLVVATTGDQAAVAVLTVSNGKGDGDGDGEGEGDGEGKGEGDGSGDGSGEGSGKGDADGGSGGFDFDDCGSGSGGAQRPWEQGDDCSDGAVDAGRGNLIREQVAREIQEHVKSRGTVPGGWTRWADTILKPQVDWRKELRAVVRRTTATVAGMRDYTYQRPSRRAGSVPNVILPAMRAPRPPQVAVVVDTSGSVSDRMLGQAIGDMQALLKQITSAGGTDIKLIACDAAAADMKNVRDMKNLTALEGGGGTDMRVGMNAAADITPKVDLVVVFTDGETPWPEVPPKANPRAKYVAVLLAGETSGYSEVPSWMHSITVEADYLNGKR